MTANASSSMQHQTGDNFLDILTDKQMEFFLLFLKEYYGNKKEE